MLRAHLLESTAARQIALVDAVVPAAVDHAHDAFQPMAPEVFAAYFDQWEGERGHQLWIRNKADRILISGAGHFSPEDRPAEVAGALVDFLT